MPLSKQIYELLGPAGQMSLDRGRYALGRLPRVHPTGPARLECGKVVRGQGLKCCPGLGRALQFTVDSGQPGAILRRGD